MDEIQRKLSLIDKQLAGGTNFHNQIISTCPLAFAATGLITGIVLQNNFSLPTELWLTSLTLFAMAAGAVFCLMKENARSQTMAYITFASFVCLGAIRLVNYYQPEASDIRNLVGDERRLATIRGIIITEPYINEYPNWHFAKFTHCDPSSSFYLKISEVKTTTGWANVGGTVRVLINEPVLDLKAGDYIEVYCWLDRFKKATNAGQFNTAEYMARKNIYVAALVKSRNGIEVHQTGCRSIFAKIQTKLKEAASQALLGDYSAEDMERGLLEALLLGYRSNIDSDTSRAFSETGLAHFLSLSGSNVGILMGIIWWLCKTAGLAKPSRATICIIATGIFLSIVPPQAPTLRAGIIFTVFCISVFFRRHSNSVNTLSLAAIILLLIQPSGLFDAGWQLSFGSVLGIIFFTDPIKWFMHDKMASLVKIKRNLTIKPLFVAISRYGQYVSDPLATGIAAWLGGAGILLYHFYTINPLTSIWTVIALPFVSLILAAGFLKMILSPLLPSLAAWFGIIAGGSTNWLIWLVKLIASWDISEILIGKTPGVIIVLYYGLILFAGFAYFRRPFLKKIICTAMALSIIAFLGTAKWQRTYRNNLVVTTLNVGHGQAILAQLPGKANILFDAGSMYNRDIGRGVVGSFLSYSGINKIDAIIISHNDIDHINGIPEIAESCKIGGVYADGAFFSKSAQWGTAKFLREQLGEKGLSIQPVSNELNLKSKARIKVIWPNKDICRNKDLGDNDKALVSLIEFAGKKILISSDIEKFAQREIIRLFPDLKADVVVVPHHGSSKSPDKNFLHDLMADILIYSCSLRQYERQQNAEFENNSKSLCTTIDGAITVSISEDGTIQTSASAKQKK